MISERWIVYYGFAVVVRLFICFLDGNPGIVAGNKIIMEGRSGRMVRMLSDAEYTRLTCRHLCFLAGFLQIYAFKNLAVHYHGPRVGPAEAQEQSSRRPAPV